MKIWIVLILSAIILITTGILGADLVRWTVLNPLQMGSVKASDSTIYMFPRIGTLRFADTQGSLHFNFKTNLISSGATAHTDSLTIVYQCLSYTNNSFADTPAEDLADGTIISGGTNFPILSNFDWDSGAVVEYPNLTSALYAYGPCQGILLIATYTTADDSDSVAVIPYFDEQ